LNESVAEMKESGLNDSRVALEDFPIWPVHPLAPHPFAPHPWAPHAWAPHPWAPHPWAPHPWSMHPWHFDVSNNRNRSDVAELEALLKSWEQVLFDKSVAEMKKSGLNVSKVAFESFPIWPIHPFAPHPFAPHPWAPHAWAPHPWAPHPWAPHPWSMHPWQFDALNSSERHRLKRQESLLSVQDAVLNTGAGDNPARGLSRTKPPRRRLRGTTFV